MNGAKAGGVVPDGYEMQFLALKNSCCNNKTTYLCDIFQNLYKPVSCHRYVRPQVAYIRGAGHFNTFNNKEFNFNGKGEFVYMDLGNPP